MLLTILSIRDEAIGEFTNPFFVNHKGSALRSFSDALANPEADYSKHPDDFDLYEIGVYDTESGELVQALDSRPILLLRGKDAKPKPNVN